jgi:predicted dehydrogenase
MIKLAMIGAGGYAYELIKRVWMIPDKIKLIAVVSNPAWRDAGRADCQAKGVSIYDDVDQFLENIKGAADAIHIPTPIHTHLALAKKCIDAGFNIFLEKPPVPTIQEYDELVEYVSKHKRSYRVPIGFQSLYSDIVQELKKRVVEGRYGKVKRISGMAGWPRLDTYYSRSGWTGRLRLNGNWILDGTINNPLAHMLANELYLASAEPGKMAQPVSVQAELYHAHNIDSEDTSSVRVITDKGAELLFNASLCSDARMDPLMIIECEKATIEYFNYKTAKIKLSDGTVDQIDDNSEQRVNMFTRLADSLENNKPYTVPLEICRPFTLSVNGAFESSGKVHPIDKNYISRLEQEGDVKTVISDIDNVLKTAQTEGKLFSEVGAQWAQKTKKFNLKGYKKFPTVACFD